MSRAGFELQKAIWTRLAASVALQGLLGGARIFDDVPQRTELPYVTIGESSVRDWSTGSEEGGEHIVTLHVWSRAAGRKETHEIMAAIEDELREAPLVLAGHRLVNLRHEFSGARREPDGETYHGTVRLRAVTEPL